MGKKKQIEVVGLNVEADLEITRQEQKSQGCEGVDWLVQTEESNYFEKLNLESIPAWVLVSPEGRVLKVGHPADQDWTEAIDALL